MLPFPWIVHFPRAPPPALLWPHLFPVGAVEQQLSPQRREPFEGPCLVALEPERIQAFQTFHEVVCMARRTLLRPLDAISSRNRLWPPFEKCRREVVAHVCFRTPRVLSKAM